MSMGSRVEASNQTLIGNAPPFVRATAKIPMVARAEGTTLIMGETGTGKELIAWAIHRMGQRAKSPFVAVNCGAFVETLFESEIFGHERGAFTDANTKRSGLIAQASGGTLFMDEVDSLVPRAQVALLRVLQDRTYRTLGSTCEQQVNVRFIAATNTPLDGLIQEGKFRADLYYRLSVFTICLPPLRERKEDILDLAEHFIDKYCSTVVIRPRLSEAAMRVLLEYRWPGNVRELENTIQRAVFMAEGPLIEPESLGIPGQDGPISALSDALEEQSYKAQKRRVIETFEREYLTRLMIAHAGNVSQAARAAGKERRDLGKLLKRHRLNPKLFATA